jgi:hypothetical protein
MLRIVLILTSSLLSIHLFSQAVTLNPKSIKIETIFDFENGQHVEFQNTNFEFELAEFQDENIYYRVKTIDSLVDDEGTKYNINIPTSSFDNQSTLVGIEFDSLSKTANYFSVYGKLNKLNRLEDDHKIVFKYPYNNLNKVAFQSDENQIKIYILDLKELFRLKSTDKKGFEKIMNDFKENDMFSDSPQNFSLEAVKQNIEASVMDDESIILFVSDKKDKIIKINLLNSNNEVINYGYSIREGVYKENAWFVTLYNIQNDVKDSNYLIEVLVNQKLADIPFKIEKIRIP